MKTSVKWLYRIFITGVVLYSLLFISFYYNWWGTLPSITELENPTNDLSSEVYAADGTLIGRYFVQDRSNSTFEEISPNAFKALIATEDERFYDHSGIDGRAVLRAMVTAGGQGGGSTITQQLALNLFNGQRAKNKLVRITQKFKEWVLAIKLERNLTKNEIITLYLNTVPFGDNVYGIKNASLTFFSKQPGDLTLDEAAVLIGMLKGNTYYNPRRHPDRSLLRRNTVIDQMVKNETFTKITPAEAEKYKARELKLNYHKLDYHEGIAPYFRQVVEQEVKKICKDLKKDDGSNYNIYKDGLKIYTTLDPRMQKYAEEAVEEHLESLQKVFIAQSGYRDGSIWKNHQNILKASMKQTDRYLALKDDGKSDAEIEAIFNTPVKTKVFAWNTTMKKDTVMSPYDSIRYTKTFLQAGFSAIDPYTGEVKAWVGGINHDYFQFDHVNENTKRQVGSTIKPLLYCLAIDNGMSPCGNVSTAPQSFDGKMYNAGGAKYGGMVMKKALAFSVNNAALYLIKQVGIPAFADFIHRCGINSNIVKYPSIALGVSDISLIEMLQAYTMFPSGGMNTQPYFIAKIEDKNGSLLKSFAPKQKEIISASTAYKMVKMMQGVVDFGTAKRMRFRYNIKGDIAGKTGTTNSQADGWFIGYTPQIMAGAWVGCDDRFLRFRSEAYGQGAAAALPIWALFYKKITADKSLDINTEMKFTAPEDFDDCGGTYDPTSEARAGLNWGSSGGSRDDDDNENVPNDDADQSNLWKDAVPDEE